MSITFIGSSLLISKVINVTGGLNISKKTSFNGSGNSFMTGARADSVKDLQSRHLLWQFGQS